MTRAQHPIPIKGPSGRTYQMYGPEGGDHQAAAWERGGFYEGAGVLSWAFANPQYFERVLDIGASLGNHSCFFAGELGAYVTAVEPYTHDICAFNLKTNGLNRRSEVIPRAVGSGRFDIIPGPPGNVGMTRLVPGHEVRGWELWGLIRLAQPTAIKIDVEGSDILSDSWDELSSSRAVIIIEETDADRLEIMDQRLIVSHERMSRVFNATPTHVYLPL